jgi:hypothetical protein
MDDIIFGGSSHALVVKFSDTMSREFEMSMMGELTFFLGLQIKQTHKGTFVHQGKYTNDVLKKFDMGEAKPLSMPMSTTIVTPQVFSSITALHLHEHKHASFHVILCGCN